MTSEQLVSVAGLILSLAFFYIPGLSGAYEGLTAQGKAAVMAVLLAVVTAASYGLSCSGDFAYFTCDRAGVWAAVELFALALAANQATYLVVRNFKAPPDIA